MLGVEVRSVPLCTSIKDETAGHEILKALQEGLPIGRVKLGLTVRCLKSSRIVGAFSGWRAPPSSYSHGQGGGGRMDLARGNEAG